MTKAPTTRPVWHGPAGLKKLLVPIGLLAPHPSNPRKHDLPAIMQSLKQLGQQKPIVVVPPGRVHPEFQTIVAGHGTTFAARELGWSHVAAVESDLEDVDIERFVLADNRTSDRAGYDDEVLAKLLAEVQERGGLDGTSYDDGDLSQLLADLRRRAASSRDPDDSPPLPDTAKSTFGSIYELGDHRLMCGDATDAEQLAALLAGEMAAVVFTDPPYGVAYAGGTKPRERLAGDEDPGIYSQFLPLLGQVSRPSAAMYLFYADRHSVPVELAVRDAGWEVRNHLVWHKVNAPFGTLGAQYKLRHELLLYAHRKGRSPKWYGPTNEVTVWEHARAPRNDYHPTQKPVELAERAYGNSSRAGEPVLDLFAGSGSSVIAAESTGRRAYAMEIDPRYCDVVRQRYADYVGDPSLAP